MHPSRPRGPRRHAPRWRRSGAGILAAVAAAWLAACSDDGPREAPVAVGPPTRSDDLGVYAEVAPRLAFPADAARPASYALASTPPLGFPSGRIVAADGIMLLEGTPAFAREVPAGRFPVDVLLGRYLLADGQPWDEVLVAGVRFSEAPIVRWSGAGPEGGREARTAAEVPCYPVDSGTGGLFDAAAFAAFGASYYGLGKAGRELVGLVDGRNQPPVTGLDGPTGGGAVFRSGGGDGCYQSFFGLDAEGRAVLIVTDFTGVLDVPLDGREAAAP